jgi:hypothetical protein
MARENPPDPKPRPVGRPRTRPAGARYWAQWVTDEERAALVALLARMRKANAPRK